MTKAKGYSWQYNVYLLSDYLYKQYCYIKISE